MTEQVASAEPRPTLRVVCTGPASHPHDRTSLARLTPAPQTFSRFTSTPKGVWKPAWARWFFLCDACCSHVVVDPEELLALYGKLSLQRPDATAVLYNINADG